MREIHQAYVRRAMSSVINEIKEELDEHLDTINANTNEIQTNCEYLCELDNKINKLNEKIEEIQLELGLKKKQEKFEKIKLTLREQEVFLVLYTSEESLSYRDISRRLGLTDALIKDYVEALIMKGIPIIKRYSEDKVLVLLDEEFKRLQARENVLGLSEVIVRNFV